MKRISCGIELKFKAISDGAVIAVLTLNRPEVLNALNRPLLVAFREALTEITAHGSNCRLLLLEGAGGNFCAGADLNWMQAAPQLSEAENLAESVWLMDCFKTLYDLPLPTIALVQGVAFGGGVGLAACCDWVIADDGAKFCLPETRIGNLAASILPFLISKFKPPSLRRWILSGQTFSAEQALAAGLVEVVASEKDWNAVIRREVQALLKGEPGAQSAFKAIHQNFIAPELRARVPSLDFLAKTFAEKRVGPAGREGFRAFLEKRPADWVISLPIDWQYH